MNIYFLFYYRIYKATYKTNSIAEFSSMVVLSTLILLNVVTLILTIYPTFSKVISKNEFIAGSMCILSINYLIFIYKQRYLKIIDEYSKKKWANKFIMGVITIIYIFGSIFLLLHILSNLP
jgi:hypothetical protein